MWLDKAAKFGKYLFLTDFFDRYAFNNIKILDQQEVNGKTTYHVKANYYIKDRECDFYINDFSIMTDVMENPNYAIKNSNMNVDATWGLYIESGLNDEETKQYRKEFKEYHEALLKEKIEQVKEF